MTEVIENVATVKIAKSRWSAKFELTLADGTVQTYIASADSGITWGDGLFLGTDEEYREALNGF